MRRSLDYARDDKVGGRLEGDPLRDSFAFLPLAKIVVWLGLALASGAHPHRIFYYSNLAGTK